MNKPDSYRLQQCCKRCRFVERIQEHDDPDHYYCNIDRSVRPQSGSVKMKEFVLNPFSEEQQRVWSEWDKWCKGRQVEPYGICDHYEPVD